MLSSLKSCDNFWFHKIQKQDSTKGFIVDESHFASAVFQMTNTWWSGARSLKADALIVQEGGSFKNKIRSSILQRVSPLLVLIPFPLKQSSSDDCSFEWFLAVSSHALVKRALQTIICQRRTSAPHLWSLLLGVALSADRVAFARWQLFSRRRHWLPPLWSLLQCSPLSDSLCATPFPAAVDKCKDIYTVDEYCGVGNAVLDKCSDMTILCGGSIAEWGNDTSAKTWQFIVQQWRSIVEWGNDTSACM